MGSLRFDGVRFQVFSFDHLPPHVHGYYGEASVVIELQDADEIRIRPGSKRPSNAKRTDISRIVDAAAAHYAELMEMWEATHGKVSR